LKRHKKPTKRYLSPKTRRGKGYAPPEPYRSWLEADVAQDLKRKKVDFEYETFTIPYVVPTTIRTYKPDIRLPNGIIVEIKGRWTAHDRSKMGYVIEQNPELDIRMLFAADNKISKNSRTRYSTWCSKRGIVYAVGTAIPEEWLNE
jgi:hypothetical protein